MSEVIRSFEDLDCWKAGTEVRRFVMDIVKKFSPHEKFSLTDNMTRAARSVTQNIAEGYGRFHYQENIQFCRQSRGSLQELIDQFIPAKGGRGFNTPPIEADKAVFLIPVACSGDSSLLRGMRTT